MTDNKYFPLIVVVVVAAAVLFTAALIAAGNNTSTTSAVEEPEYVSKIFNETKVTEINIEIDDNDWDWIIENAGEEEYRACDITINNITFNNVGIRPKGNSSLRTVIQDETTDRFSFKLEFDTYVEGQSCFGLNKLALNNVLSDNTYMKEFLAYNMFETMGVSAPKYAYANITINGEPWGLYLAVECMEEDFVERSFGSLDGNLYRPEGTGADLVWKGESASNYSGIKSGAAYDVTDSDFQKVITMIENLNTGTNLEQYLDVDAVLRYFAVNTFLVNFDNYTGNMKHNYYLYEENGVCTILPWDYNLAFGGFGISSAEEAINYPIDTPVTGDLSARPLIGKLLEVPEYKELYHKYLGELVESYIDSGLYQNLIEEADALIMDYVKNDATAFCTYNEYQKSLPVLLKFGELRAQSITNQLTGKQVSVAQKESDPAAAARIANNIDNGTADMLKVSAEGVALKSLGSMGGGGMGGGGMGGGGKGGQGGPGGGDMPDQETMSQVREILGAADGGELTEQQIAELKELGLNDEMIERMKNMPDGEMKNPGDPAEDFGNMEGRNRTISTQQLAYTAAAVVAMLLGLLFVLKARKRKFSS